MEQKYRDYIPQLQDGSHPQWLLDAARDYKEQVGPSYTESSFLRGNLSIQLIDQLFTSFSHSPNVLLVGLGRSMEPIVSTYEPFRISAHLQGKGYNYRMTLVDVDLEVINEVRTRQTLYIPIKANPGTVDAWQKYLTDTQQGEREVHELEQGLVLANYLRNTESPFYYDILGSGVSAADVSPQFRQKLQSGEVSLVHADIAVADIHTRGPYDYAEFTNVLYLMSLQGQQLAMANISQSLAPEGRLLINDIGGYTGEPLLPRFGGWFDEEKMAQLGLEIDEVMYAEKSSETFLLKKKV